MARTSVPDFQTANPLYAGSSVTFFTVDVNGVKTTTKASLFDSPVAGGALANPQVLDSDGKFAAPVYIEVAVIMSIAGVHVADHDTGVIAVPGTWRGDWVTATVYYPGDTVRDGANGDNSQDLYRVISQHTSGTWATDKADATKLALAVSVADIAGHRAASAGHAAYAAVSAQRARKEERNAEDAAARADGSATRAAAVSALVRRSEKNTSASEVQAQNAADRAAGFATLSASEALQAQREADAAAASAASVPTLENIPLPAQVFS